MFGWSRCTSDFALGWDDERLAILSREHRIGGRVVDELFGVQIELEPGSQRQWRLFDIDAILGQMLPRSLERVLLVVEEVA